MLDKLRLHIENLAIGDPLQFYMLVGLLAFLLLAMLLVIFSDSGGKPGQTAKAGAAASAKTAASRSKGAKKTSNAAKKASKSEAGERRQPAAEAAGEFAFLKRSEKPAPQTDPAVDRLAEIEQEMLALRALFQSGEISRETYVSDSRALYNEATRLAAE